VFTLRWTKVSRLPPSSVLQLHIAGDVVSRSRTALFNAKRAQVIYLYLSIHLFLSSILYADKDVCPVQACTVRGPCDITPVLR